MSQDLPVPSPANYSRVLILSMRNFESWVARSFLFEFEYALEDFEQVDICSPSFSPTILSRLTRKISRSSFNATGKSVSLSSNANQFSLDKEYDLFIFACQFPAELYYLDSIKDWRKKCHKAVCWLDEVWIKEVDSLKIQLTALKQFDHVFMNMNFSVKQVAEIAQRPCSYMPPGIDAIKFCPYPLQPQRSIDVCSIGRRPDAIHESLLNLAEKNNFFYMYDTLKISFISNYNSHRSLYRNLIKRSRYFMAYKPKYDIESLGGTQEELNVRFFEGAAGGAILLGIPPNCEAFSQNFDWSDAVIPLPIDATNVGEIIAHLDSQPERLNKIRTDNVVNSLLRHDWVYRWEKILAAVDIPIFPGMIERKAKLKELAEIVAVNNLSIK
ncbi:MAG: glycosyltransferase family 1 protein [Tatlockia sp.]|nr:glycosyltransferase family 1 protein [Tatlockia sp.]